MRSAASLLMILLAAGCGGDDAAPSPQASATGACAAAQRAVYDGDWPALKTLLTTDARIALQGDMMRIQKNLAEPAKAPMLHKVARAATGDAYEAEVRTAVQGGMPELLRFFATKLSPRPRDPRPVSHQIDPKTGSMTIEYVTNDGVKHPIKMVRLRGLWFVSSLQL